LNYGDILGLLRNNLSTAIFTFWLRPCLPAGRFAKIFQNILCIFLQNFCFASPC